MSHLVERLPDSLADAFTGFLGTWSVLALVCVWLLGPFFGALSFALLFVVMTVFGIDEPGKLIAQGLIILLAAIFYGLRSGNAN